MKNKLVYILVLSGTIFSSCNDFLDKKPDNRADMNSKDNIRELLVSAYPEQTYVSFLETMSDNAGDRNVSMVYERTIEEAYKWEDYSAIIQDTPNGFWSASYAAIAAANHALEAIRDYEGDEDLSAQKGEALVCRAYNHFMLVNTFAQHYDPQYSKNDLGIPYLIEPETTVFGDYHRLSVDSVYKLIVTDLEEGLLLINDAEYESPKFHFTRSATYAFATRLYLYLGRFNDAVNAANQILGDDPTTHLRDMAAYSSLSTSKKPTAYTSTDERSILLMASCITLIGAYQPFYQYGLTSEKKDEIMGQNPVHVFLRKNGITNLSAEWYYTIVSYTLSNEYNNALKWEYYFKQGGLYADTGLYYSMIPLFTYEEVLLDRAEAYVMLGEYDKARADINAFLSTRVKGKDEVKNVSVAYDKTKMTLTDSFIQDYYADKVKLTSFYLANEGDTKYIPQQSYINCILSLKRIEFLTEGKRWFDVKRYGIEVVHTPYNQPSNKSILEKRDLRRAVQIPESAQANGIEKNPR